MNYSGTELFLEDKMRLTNEQLLCEQSIMDESLSKFKGMLVSDIKETLLINANEDTKASFVKLARKMLNLKSNAVPILNESKTAILKTVRVTGSMNPAESMSFMQVPFDEWCTAENWESCSLYQYFENTPLLFFIFQQYPTGKRVKDTEMRFLGVKLWQMSEYDINHGLYDLWERVRGLINGNEIIIEQKVLESGVVRNMNNLPSSKFNGIVHLRPGGKDGKDLIQLPTGQHIVRQRLWLNASYIKDIIL